MFIARAKASTRALVLGLALLTFAGCYGPFNLTRKLHRWNGEVGEKWANEGVFLVCIIFPVYFFATLGDAIIFNSIEFWGGENPISAASADEVEKAFENGDQRVVLRRSDAGGVRRMSIKIYEQGALAGEYILEGGLERPTLLKNGQGEVIGQAMTLADGKIAICDGQGNATRVGSLGEIAALKAQAAGGQ
jgi:hypothetical protein